MWNLNTVALYRLSLYLAVAARDLVNAAQGSCLDVVLIRARS